MHTPPLTLATGFTIPMLGLGTWNSPVGEVGAAVEFALKKAHYRHIDCAAIYLNEQEIGNALARVFKSGAVARSEVFITSKLWNTDHHPDMVESACRQTLDDLQLEYLDLYLVHWAVPFAHGEDPEPLGEDGVVRTQPIPLFETWRAMEKLVSEGLVKSIGVANFTTPVLLDLLHYAQIKPAVNQIELHPYNAQTALVEFCRRHEIAVTAYSPLGSPGGAAADAPHLLDEAVIIKIAKAHHKSPAQVLIRWAVQRGTVAIPKSVTPERILENAAVFDFELTTEQMESITHLDRKYRFVNPINWWGIPYFD